MPSLKYSCSRVGAHVDEREHDDGGVVGERRIDRGPAHAHDVDQQAQGSRPARPEAESQEQQHRRRRDERRAQTSRALARRRRRARGRSWLASRLDPVDADLIRDVLDRLVAEVGEADVELVAHLLVHGRRDADAARLGQRLQTCGDVDAVAVDPSSLGGDVSHVDADPEVHAALGGEARVECPQHSLDLDCGADGVEGGRELGEDVVTRSIHDPASVLPDAHRDLLAVVAERPDRGRLVLGHQAAVADGIGGEDRGELAFDLGSHRLLRCGRTSLLRAPGRWDVFTRPASLWMPSFI